ncbi:MAG: GIY-YIG nuclease family protein [Candidatus Bathyarchaeia archaeon]
MSKGVYTVILGLSSGRSVRVGRLGAIAFDRGFYGYTGSAMGRGGFSLEGRIARYLRRSVHKPFWHIDYLLLEAELEAVVYAICEKSLEHRVASMLSRRVKPIVGFGSSDCRYGCKAHLHYLGVDVPSAMDTVISVYRSLDLEPRVIWKRNGDIFKLEEDR